MSLFNSKPKKEKAVVPVTAQKSPVVNASASTAGHIRHDVLVRPHVTEKATASAQRGVYVFEVSLKATKKEITKAVRALYKVVPVKVAIVPILSKKIIVKGRHGATKGSKKAYVYLKKGDKLEIV